MFCRLAARVLAAAALLLAAAAGLTGPAAQSGGGAPLVLTTPVEGAIGPPTTRHIESVLETAAARDAALVVLRMDTPGGLASSTRDINRAILASPVPVAVLVAPAGARAASAGTYILYASHVAAMAPGTNLGAATPVAAGGGGGSPLPGGGGDGGSPLPGGGGGPPQDGEGGGDAPAAPADDAAAPQDALAAKRINDAVASIRALAELRGRNADWAEKAVREAASLTASAAAEQNVIDFVAADVPALLATADGRTVSVDGQDRRLELSGARVETVTPTLITRILSVLANPNIALLLMTLGFYGLLYELASPGLGPGVVGAILMLLGLYSLNTLPVNYAGVALILLGLALLAAEILSPSFGILGIGGIIAFALGAAMLIDTEADAFQVSWGVIATLSALTGAVVLLLIGAVVNTRRRAPRASAGAMAGQAAEILDWQGGTGHVRANGELWRAAGPDDLSPGDRAHVARVEGLTLHLRRDAGGARQRKDD